MKYIVFYIRVMACTCFPKLCTIAAVESDKGVKRHGLGLVQAGELEIGKQVASPGGRSPWMPASGLSGLSPASTLLKRIHLE